MSNGLRRAIGVGVAAALLGAAFAGTASLSSAREAESAKGLQDSAERARTQAQDAINVHLRKLQTRAEAASSLPELRAQIGVVDASTLRDGFNSEPWWQPVRREASITALALSGNGTDLSLGVPEQDFDAADLVQKARESRTAAGLALAKGNPYLAAASVVDKPGRRPQPVLVLARPLDEELLDGIVKITGSAVMVSDGNKAVAAAGPTTARTRLAGLAGTEGSPKATSGWVALPAQLGPHLWIWAYVAGPSAASGLGTTVIAIWAAAGVGALLALFLGFKAPGAPASVTSTGSSQPGLSQTNSGTAVARGQTAADTPVVAKTEAMAPSSPPPPEKHDPNQFGRYTLLDKLGEGGMADVYTAVTHGAEGFRRTFVVKRLRAHLTDRQDLVNMFIDEARLGSSLVHSNIIPVFDFGKVGQEYYMATEYILGRDLRKITEKSLEVDGKPMPPDVVLYIAQGVLEALDYAHKLHDEEGKPMGLVHRDVSPNNILLSVRGEVKLFDFGIAKAEGRLTQTQVGAVKGNYRFMSSEQAYGNPVDSRSDVCSLGLTLYFALAGDALYDGASLVELLRKAASGPGDEEWAKISQLPEGIREVIWHSIQGDREQRYANAAEFLAAVHELPMADAATAAKLMEKLFGKDLKAEQQKFNSVKTGMTDPKSRPSASRG